MVLLFALDHSDCACALHQQHLQAQRPSPVFLFRSDFLAMLSRYHQYVLLIKLDTYFFVCIAAQYIFVGWFESKIDGHRWDLDEFVTYISSALAAALLFFAMGYIGVWKSSRPLMGVFLALLAGISILAAMLMFTVINSSSVAYHSTTIWLTSFCKNFVIISYDSHAATHIQRYNHVLWCSCHQRY